MDYYRHCFNDSDFLQNSLNALADFGFVEKSTREPYYGSFPINEDIPSKDNWKQLCWKNDLKADLHIQIGLNTSTSGNSYSGFSISPSSQTGTWRPSPLGSLHLLYNYAILGVGANHVSNPTYWWYNSIIIMPLINGGFLYNVNFLNRYGDGQYTVAKALDPTPKVKIVGEYNDTMCDFETSRTLIGIPNTLNTNLSNYLYFGLTGAYKHSQTGHPNEFFIDLLTDYQQGRVIENIPYINTASTDYTDLNNNICTLIKMPYDNGYLDNVYMMATRPGELTKEGSFFSFAGRNFINVYKNLVLELPS